MKTYSLDLETYLITDEQSFPKPVCLSWVCHDNSDDYGIAGNDLNSFVDPLVSCLEKRLRDFFKHDDCILVWQNGYAFDIPVIWTHFPSLRSGIIKALDEGRIRDTLIREKLFDLSTTGRINIKKGSYSLAGMARKYLGKDLSKWKSGNDIWRLRYSELDNIPAESYPEDARSYCLLDVQVQRDVYEAQEKHRKPTGYGSINTEDIQIKSGFVLSLATARGLEVDLKALDVFESDIDSRLDPLKKKLIKLKYAKQTEIKERKNGTLAPSKFTKNNKSFLAYLLHTYPDYVTRTSPTKTHPKGQIRIDDEALAEYPDDEIIQTRLTMSLLEKYKGTYCANIRKANGVLRARYDILKETGRTSSFIQVMPREGGVREIFRARKGYKLVTIDYAAIEAVAVAQTLHDLQLGDSLLEYLNEGNKPKDYHALLGHLWFAYKKGIRPDLEYFLSLRERGDEEATDARNQSKPGGLSIAGGIGNATMVKIAKGTGVFLTEEQAQIFREFAYDMMPEIKVFLKDWVNKQKLSGDFEYAYAYDVGGFYRNRCTYCACANGRSMQTPAALGAKEAIWSTFKHSFDKDIHLVAFVHDELIFEVPDHKSLLSLLIDSELLALEMCRGMRKYLKDLRVTAEYAIMDVWSKSKDKHIKSGKVWVNG